MRGPVSRVLWPPCGGDGHFSGTDLAIGLERPTRRTLARVIACPPYLVFLRVGFALPALSPGLRCALTAPFHPYLWGNESPNRRYLFCGTFPGLAAGCR